MELGKPNIRPSTYSILNVYEPNTPRTRFNNIIMMNKSIFNAKSDMCLGARHRTQHPSYIWKLIGRNPFPSRLRVLLAVTQYKMCSLDYGKVAYM